MKKKQWIIILFILALLYISCTRNPGGNKGNYPLEGY